MSHHEKIKYETATVAIFVLIFLQFTRRVYQTPSSLKLPYLSGLLAVYCETELACSLTGLMPC